MRGKPARLTQGLDVEIDQVIRKLEADNPQLPLTSFHIYQAIQKSNSSLRRRKKQLLDAEIERVLEFRRNEARENDEHDDSEAEIEMETEKVYAARVCLSLIYLSLLSLSLSVCVLTPSLEAGRPVYVESADGKTVADRHRKTCQP